MSEIHDVQMLNPEDSAQIDAALRKLILRIGEHVIVQLDKENIVSRELLNKETLRTALVFVSSFMSSIVKMPREQVIESIMKASDVIKECPIFNQDDLQKEFMTTVEVGGNA